MIETLSPIGGIFPQEGSENTRSRPAPSSKNMDFERALDDVTSKTHRMMANLAREGGKGAILGGDNQNPMQMVETLVGLLQLESDGRTQKVMNESVVAQEEGNRLMRMGVAAGLIGKSVDGEAGLLSYDPATDKKPQFKAIVPPYLERISFVVADHNGTVLNEYPLDAKAGPRNIDWDGKVRNAAGTGYEEASKGIYRFGMKTLGHDGKEAIVPVYTTRTISSVDTQRLQFFDGSGQPLGGLDALINLREAATAA